jgi:hypothetical protein
VSLHKLALAVAGVTFLSGHVAPSVDDNNRYLKVTPLGDGVRLAYLVFFGEIPGASERRGVDANRDGRIDEGEARRYGDKLAAQVLASLDVEADGAPVRIRWTTVDVGMGTDAVVAGSFSVDLVTYVCFASGPGKHRVRVRDQFRIPRPGETEVKVEDSPGVTVARARVGAHDDPSHDYRFVGPGGALSDDGLEVELVSTARAPMVPNNLCGHAGTTAAKRALPTAALVALLGLVLGGIVAAIAVIRRRRR